MIKKKTNKLCPVCQNELKFWIEKKRRAIFKCSHCNHICVPAGQLKDENNSSIYERDKPIFENDDKIDYYLDETNLLSAKKKKELVKNYIKNGADLLDIGSNYGHFLFSIKDVFNGVGLEISPSAVNWSQHNFDVKTFIGSAENIPPEIQKEFKVITMWDVIEHLENPNKALDEVYNHLENDGYFFLSTPDSSSWIARLLGRRWYHLDPEQHINLFSKKNLKKILKEKSFKIVKVSTIGHIYRLNYIKKKIFGSGGSKNIKKNLLYKMGKIKIYIKLFDVALIIVKKNK